MLEKHLPVLKKLLVVFFGLVVFTGAAYLTYILLNVSEINVGSWWSRFPTPTPQVTSGDVPLGKNILLLGYGGAGHDGGGLSDSIMVVNLDKDGKKANLITIPRDAWVQVPIRSDIKEFHKINAAYAIGMDDTKYGLKEPQYRGEAGGGNMAKVVVGELTGMPIQYFIAVDFEGLKNIVDTLGGVEVNVPVSFNDYFYPVKGLENETCGFSAEKIAELHEKYSGFELEKQFECRYEHLQFSEGLTKMDGETALKFVRSRHSSEHGGDFARSQRQKALLIALKDKLLSLYSIKSVDEIVSQFGDMVRTDVDANVAGSLINLYGSPEDYELNFISLTDENVFNNSRSADGQFILVPKAGEGIYTEIHNFIKEEMNK